MSKNFELIQQAEFNTNTASSPARESVMALGVEANLSQSKSVPVSVEMIAREESQKLVQNLFVLPQKDAPKMVVFAGIDTGRGCSAICIDTARVLASRVAGSVCIVDANLLAPSLPEMFGVGNHYGLTDSLRESGAIQQFAKVVGPDNLWLLSCGSLMAESLGQLNSESLRARILELRSAFDYVLIDSPPLNKQGDAIALGQMADGLVMVIEANSTRREAAGSIAQTLRAARVQILGAVLNNRTFPIPEVLYRRL